MFVLFVVSLMCLISIHVCQQEPSEIIRKGLLYCSHMVCNIFLRRNRLASRRAIQGGCLDYMSEPLFLKQFDCEMVSNIVVCFHSCCFDAVVSNFDDLLNNFERFGRFLAIIYLKLLVSWDVLVFNCSRLPKSLETFENGLFACFHMVRNMCLQHINQATRRVIQGLPGSYSGNAVFQAFR